MVRLLMSYGENHFVKCLNGKSQYLDVPVCGRSEISFQRIICSAGSASFFAAIGVIARKCLSIGLIMNKKVSMLSILLLAVVGMSQAAAPVGDTVWLYSVSTDSYVTMDPSNGNWLAANNVSTVGTNEQFVVEDAGSGNILLKSVVNSNYVKADLDDAKKLKANTTSNTDTLAHFEWIELGDGKIRLRNIGNGLNIRPRGAALVLRANTTATGIETEFTGGIVVAVDPEQ